VGWQCTNFDSFQRSQQVIHLDGTSDQREFGCCGLANTTDRDGVMTQYTYDIMKRRVSSARLGITVSNVFDSAGQLLKTIRIGSDNSQIVLHQAAYDTGGRIISETNALNGPTTYGYGFNSSGLPQKTTTYADGGTRIEVNYLDGRLQSVTGTAVHGKGYTYGTGTDINDNTCSYTTETSLDALGNPTSEYTTTYTDMLGRTTEVLYADGSYSQSFYNSLGQLGNSVDPDGVTTLYQYNGKGEQVVTAMDMEANTNVDFGGSDRITSTINDVTSDHGTGVRRSRTYVWSMVNSTASNLVSMTETSTDGRTNWQMRYGPTSVTNQNSTVYNGTYRTNTATAEDGSSVVTLYTNGVRKSVTLYNSNPSPIGATTFSYDAHGRLATETDG